VTAGPGKAAALWDRVEAAEGCQEAQAFRVAAQGAPRLMQAWTDPSVASKDRVTFRPVALLPPLADLVFES
jgi:hypothetical protein